MKILVTGGSGFIGTNLIEYLQNTQYTFINLDKNQPLNLEHLKYWVYCDILDKEHLANCFLRFSPDFVIHLAAKTDTNSNLLSDYIENTEGTKNILSVVQSSIGIHKLIITSSQFVHQFHGTPQSDTEFAPHTAYGRSKVINEIDTRAAQLNCCWTIVRPTNIWGPWHKRYPYEFWKVLIEKKYLHPGFSPVIRSYGYVGNIVHQLMKIIELPDIIVNKKVIYLSDSPIDMYLWTNGFSMKLVNQPVKRVPKFFILCLAMIGEILKLFKIRFPISYSRYLSMVTNNSITLIDKTFELLGNSPYNLDEGIDITIQWLRKYHEKFFRIQV